MTIKYQQRPSKETYSIYERDEIEKSGKLESVETESGEEEGDEEEETNLIYSTR